MKEYLPLFKSLANETRILIYETICNDIFLTKSQLMKKLGIENRPTLDHHLSYLEKAGLVYQSEILFENHRLVFLLPLQKVIIPDNLLIEFPDTKRIFDQIEKELDFENYNNTINRISDIILKTAFRTALGNAIIATGKDFHCELCQGKKIKKASILCQNCGRFVCKNCSKDIKRPSGIIEQYCFKCEREFFFPKSV